jgi:hypothetical protein
MEGLALPVRNERIEGRQIVEAVVVNGPQGRIADYGHSATYADRVALLRARGRRTTARRTSTMVDPLEKVARVAGVPIYDPARTGEEGRP